MGFATQLEPTLNEMTTWIHSVRHPWFTPPKRKLCTDDDDDVPFTPAASPVEFTTSRRKRVRYGSLERTLAHMTLGSALASTSEDWPKISLPCPYEHGTLNVVLPGSVEEPDADTDIVMEVEPTDIPMDPKMPTLSQGRRDWERELDIKEVQVSSAVLDRLRTQSRRPPAPIPLPSQTSQALVLYRAPGPPSPRPLASTRQPTRTSIQVAHEEDVMEVE